MTCAEIQRNAKLRKLAQLLKKRAALLMRMTYLTELEVDINIECMGAIERFLDAQKKR